MDAHERRVQVVEIDLVNRPLACWAGIAGRPSTPGSGRCSRSPCVPAPAGLGALALYQTHLGAISDDSYFDGLIAAEVITRAILTKRAGISEEAFMAEMTDGAALQAESTRHGHGLDATRHRVGDALARFRFDQ